MEQGEEGRHGGNNNFVTVSSSGDRDGTDTGWTRRCDGDHVLIRVFYHRDRNRDPPVVMVVLIRVSRVCRGWPRGYYCGGDRTYVRVNGCPRGPGVTGGAGSV